MLKILYPYDGQVSESKVIQVVKDAISNGKVLPEEFDGTLKSAIEICTHQGYYTFATQSNHRIRMTY